MDIEIIIMLSFLAVLFTAVPTTIWLINRDTKRLEREMQESIRQQQEQERQYRNRYNTQQ
jgi:hypothetical protein